MAFIKTEVFMVVWRKACKRELRPPERLRKQTAKGGGGN